MSDRKFIRIMTAAVLFLCMSVLLSLCLGAAKLTLADLVYAIRNRTESGAAGRIFWYARLPRTLAAVLAGAALAVSGAVIQSVLTNQLASPGTIGVNAGAGLAVTICCACGAVSGWWIAGAAFFGALAAVGFVTLTARKIGASRTTVILGGIAVNSFLNAVSETITTLIPDAGTMSADFRMGGFSSVSYLRLLPAGIFIAVGLFLIFTLCSELDIMALGEDTAQGLGLPVKTMRVLFLCLAALLAGAAVSFSGLLSFIGLIVPHLGRRLLGAENRRLLLFCAVFGGGFTVICDLIARMIFAPYELAVGILMSFIGGPFFIFLLIRRKGGHV